MSSLIGQWVLAVLGTMALAALFKLSTGYPTGSWLQTLCTSLTFGTLYVIAASTWFRER